MLRHPQRIDTIPRRMHSSPKHSTVPKSSPTVTPRLRPHHDHLYSHADGDGRRQTGWNRIIRSTIGKSNIPAPSPEHRDSSQ